MRPGPAPPLGRSLLTQEAADQAERQAVVLAGDRRGVGIGRVHERTVCGCAFGVSSRPASRVHLRIAALMHLWNIDRQQRVKTLVPWSGELSTATFREDGKQLLTISDDHIAGMWSTRKRVSARRPSSLVLEGRVNGCPCAGRGLSGTTGPDSMNSSDRNAGCGDHRG